MEQLPQKHDSAEPYDADEAVQTLVGGGVEAYATDPHGQYVGEVPAVAAPEVTAATLARQAAGVARADRQLRAEQGLPPPVADLR